MTYVGSTFRVIDNTGVRRVKCICCYKTGKLKLGSLILGVVKKLKPNSKKLKKGMKVQGYVVSLKKEISRKGGEKVFPNGNNVILLKKNGDMMGTRIKSYGINELRLLKKFNKFLSLSTYII
jgi:ribosomal protein L14